MSDTVRTKLQLSDADNRRAVYDLDKRKVVRPWYRREAKFARRAWARSIRRMTREAIAAGDDTMPTNRPHTGGWLTH